MTDEEYVRANWVVADCGMRHAPIRVFITVGIREFKTWAAAAKFTRERLEQVRQLKRQIETIEDNRDCERLQLEIAPFWIDEDPVPAEEDFDAQADSVVFWVRRISANVRTLVHLESALADLKQGMKSDVS